VYYLKAGDMSDKTLKEQMDRLDTLSGGIVFGKEEAWEKLQNRMERIPEKRTFTNYWLTAAAILLLLISVVNVHYYAPENRIDKTKINAPEVSANLSANDRPEQVMTATEQTVIYKTSLTKPTNVLSKKTHSTPNTTEDRPVAITPSLPAPASFTENKTEVTVPSIAPTIVPMKVVHINELEKGNKPNNVADIPDASYGIALTKLKVLHIHDVEMEAIEIRALLQENRMSSLRLPFGKPDYYHRSVNTETEQYLQPLHLLKSKLNIQN
jgi:hypothetical protein